MKIRTPALEVSHAKWIAWKDNLLSYIAFQIGRALGKKIERNPNLGKTAVLPVLPMAAALIQSMTILISHKQERMILVIDGSDYDI